MALKDRNEGKTQWEDLPLQQSRPKRGIFILIDGEEGSGKSTLALTLARIGAIAYSDIDQSIDRAKRPKMPKGRIMKVRVKAVRYKAGIGTEGTKNSCLPAWKEAKNAVIEATKTWAAGAVVDTGTEHWEVLRLGAFGTLTPKGRTDRLYGPVNAEFRQFIRTVHRGQGKHLVFINQVKDQYKDKADGTSVKTGRKERVGFKELGYLADMALTTFKEDGEFKVKVTMCKLAPHGPAMEGQIFEEDDVDLVHILSTVTDTEPSDWVK